MTSTSRHGLYTAEPPAIVMVPEDTEVAYGSTVFLVCVAVSHEPDLPSPPTIVWEMESERLFTSDVAPGNTGANVTIQEEQFEVDGVTFTRSILELCGVTLEEEGRYSCIAEDSVGTDTASFNISVFTNGVCVSE